MIQTISGLTNKTRATPPAVFALDLNCAIYHCVRKVQDVYPYKNDTITHMEFERRLIIEVLCYISYMIDVVKPTHITYIAVDGVAPMAKIRQQRMRRFKSSIAAEQEARIKAEARGVSYVPLARWDTNAITPGTQFMAKLSLALRDYVVKNPGKVCVSPADECGEGEQKIMNYIRETQPADVVVYGLDADLIVLALWAQATSNTRVDLFREEVEFNGTIKKDALNAEQYLYLNIHHLAHVLYEMYGKHEDTLDDFTKYFVAFMNFLGNDFVPHGMMLKIKDDGVIRLLEIYKYHMTYPIILKNALGEWSYNILALRQLFEVLASTEETDFLRNIRKKIESRVGASHAKNAEERALGIHNDAPVIWGHEHIFIEPSNTGVVLRTQWRELYDEHALQKASVPFVIEKYLESLSWTLAYYSGLDVDFDWYYPQFLPPRFESILHALRTYPSLNPPLKQSSYLPLQPLEQLCMVLPVSSFHLLPPEYQTMPDRHMYAWPESWGVFSIGRRYLWECEPLIPIVQSAQIRKWMRE